MSTSTRIRTKALSAALAVALTASACGGNSSDEAELLAAIEDLNAQVEGLEGQLEAGDDSPYATTESVEQDDAADDGRADTTSTDATSTEGGKLASTQESTHGTDAAPEPETQPEPEAQPEPETQPEPEAQPMAGNPEEAGEDCDAVKDRNELRLDIESPAVVIDNDLAKPGDACDFHMFYVDGMSRGVNSNGIVQLSITCSDPDVVEVALSGPGGFDYRPGGSNGKTYSCGDTWTETVNYQSDKVFFVVYIRPVKDSGASTYQVVALPVAT